MLPSIVGGAFYINLDHRTDRREEFEGEMRRVGLSCERFGATKRQPGIVGCGYSHLAVLKEARARSYESVLIFEDDFQFIVEPDVFWTIMESLKGVSYDVIMLGYNLQHSEEHSDILLRVTEAQTASAYLVHSRMYDRLIALYEYAMPQLEITGHHWIYANDQVWKSLQQISEWFATRTRIGIQRPSYSDTGEKFTENGC
jgi:hypothetical protein